MSSKRVPATHVALPFTRTNRQAVYKFHFPKVCGDCGLPVIARCDSCHVRLSVRIKTIGQRLWKDAGLPAAQSVLTEAFRRLLRMA